MTGHPSLLSVKESSEVKTTSSVHSEVSVVGCPVKEASVDSPQATSVLEGHSNTKEGSQNTQEPSSQSAEALKFNAESSVQPSGKIQEKSSAVANGSKLQAVSSVQP